MNCNSSPLPLVHKVAEAIARHSLLESGRPVIVGLSGGADSVALAVVLNRLGYECVCAHCNYHLRGEESNRDMRHAQNLCASLGIDLYVKDFDVEARRKSSGESVEMACRELRYKWFSDLMDRIRAQAIAVAHHREDNVETFFLNLMRGSGIAGLTGMRWRNGYIVRPMLDSSRTEIEDFLKQEDIEYVIDSTNLENDYARNKIRNAILPTISDLFPNAMNGILTSISHLADNRDVYDNAISEKASRYIQSNKIDLTELLENEKERSKIVLFEILRPFGFNIGQIHDILSAPKRSGATFVSGASTLLLNRGVISIVESTSMGNHGDECTISLSRDVLSPAHIVVTEHPISEFKPEKNPCVAYFDAEMMLGEPSFVLRHWRRGDRLAPYGMLGTKLVSDIFANAKLDAQEKSEAWILTRNGEILWVLGIRASHRHSIVPETKRYIRLEYRP